MARINKKIVNAYWWGYGETEFPYTDVGNAKYIANFGKIFLQFPKMVKHRAILWTLNVSTHIAYNHEK